ncbi:cytochrome P450 [Mycolicibacterium rhodesiae JS60]|nr:cytochrome P450 [Mycolicibacterium rhodesiae JS60]
MTDTAAHESDTPPGHETVEFFPLDPAVHDDFWQTNTSLRERCPVGWNNSIWSMTAPPGEWIVNDYEHAMEAATQWETFSSADGVSAVQIPLDMVRLIPVELDPPKHREIRKHLNPFFTPAALAANDGEIATIVADLMERCLAEPGPVDFVAEFTAQLPPIVFLSRGFLDQEADQAEVLLSLVKILLTNPELTLEAAPKLLAWCGELLEARRGEGRTDDLAGVIAHMGFGEDGLVMTERERVETLNLAVMAGMETTMGGLGAVAWQMAIRPDLRAELRDADERGLDRAIEEFIRFSSPVPSEGRTVTRDVEFGGCPMKSGDRVLLNFAAANLDPKQFPDPLTIDIHRPNVASHLAFGAGIHRCLGAHLARREIKASLKAICALSQFELEAGHEMQWRAAFARGPVSLPVRLAR